ncbi:MAG: hypothetical protein NC204_07640 [Candidatus Amulumruptor caecigallinarius]|nr:hypothetical protein [Candidatus Amulumruptor caecigallinarius]
MESSVLIILFVVATLGSVYDYYLIAESHSKKKAEERNIPDKNRNQKPEHNPSQEDYNTIRLIGEKAFHDMVDRIEALLTLHKLHRNMTVPIVCPPTSALGKNELHHILPGEPVSLNITYQNGVKWIDVFSRGHMIGRLTLQNASAITNLLYCNDIKGIYIGEQNCYGLDGVCRLSLIIFYQLKQLDVTHVTELVREHPDEPDTAKFKICQN